MNPEQIADIISKYGFPIVAAVGMGYFIFFIYKYVTNEISPAIKEANTVLIALIDRIRMLDNDLIRLQQKVNVTLQIKEEYQHHEHKTKN